MKNPYTWMLFALVLLDTVLTIVAIQCWGAVEANPWMRWLFAKSIFAFIAAKLIPTGCLICLAIKAGKPKYLRIAFWCYLMIYLIGLLILNHHGLLAEIPRKTKPIAVAVSPKVHWNMAVVTTYANKFEGRRMANGRTFRHRDRVVACRGGSFGRRIELRYGRNGRSVCVISDRGRLPLHQRSRWQFDTSRAVAKDLGLYRIVGGKTDRVVKWRYIR